MVIRPRRFDAFGVEPTPVLGTAKGVYATNCICSQKGLLAVQRVRRSELLAWRSKRVLSFFPQAAGWPGGSFARTTDSFGASRQAVCLNLGNKISCTLSSLACIGHTTFSCIKELQHATSFQRALVGAAAACTLRRTTPGSTSTSPCQLSSSRRANARCFNVPTCVDECSLPSPGTPRSHAV